MRNALGYASKAQQSMVGAALRQAQADRAQASQTLRHVADQLRQKWPKLAASIDESEVDVLSYLDFPEQLYRDDQDDGERRSGWRSATTLGVMVVAAH